MRTVVLGTLTDGTNSISGDSLLNGSPVSACHFNFQSTALLSDINLTTVTDRSTGEGVGNMTNTLSSADYAIEGCCNYSDDLGQRIMVSYDSVDFSTGSYGFQCCYAPNNPPQIDSTHATVTVQGRPA